MPLTAHSGTDPTSTLVLYWFMKRSREPLLTIVSLNYTLNKRDSGEVRNPTCEDRNSAQCPAPGSPPAGCGELKPAKWNRDREESHGFGSRPKAIGSAPSAAAAGENTHRRVRRSPPPMRSDPGAWDQQRTETPHGDRTHTDGLYWGTGQPELRTIAREAVPAGHCPAGLRQFRAAPRPSPLPLRCGRSCDASQPVVASLAPSSELQ